MVKKVVIGCQGGGMHVSFEVGVLRAILEGLQEPEPKFELVGLGGTSAGALCALMVWYGLECPGGSAANAVQKLEDFWEGFVAKPGPETLLNFFTFGALRAEESEVPVLGLYPPVFGLNPRGAIYKAVAASLPRLGVRKEYFDLMDLLEKACPALKNNTINLEKVKTRLLIGATEVVKGFETVFDSAVKTRTPSKVSFWHQQLPLSLEGVAASGTLPAFREAQRTKGGYYWDGLYSQNPPVREFFEDYDNVPDELWILRINPQEWPELPKTNAEIQDRQNELMGNLSLHRELDFILKIKTLKLFGPKDVIVRTIKMRKETVDELHFSSKFDRSPKFMRRLRREGHEVGTDWLARWPNVGSYPEDAGYWPSSEGR